jgi:hypothetical protein
MSLTRRYSAAVLAASVLLLGACGSESPVAPSTPEPGEVNDNPRNIFADQSTFFFTDAGGSLTGPQQLKIGGLVAIGSYVLFDSWVFSPASPAWLRMSPTPEFQRDPLRWVFNLWVDPAAYGALPNGVYTAHAHASVPAALNGPIGITALLCKGAGCLPLDGVTNGALAGTDGSWNRGGDPNAQPGAYYFDDYFLGIPPFTTVHVTNHGACSGFGLGDPYLHAFDLDDNFITSNDDGFGCLNSYIILTNGTAAAKTYRIRASSFGGGATGSYQVRTSTGAPFLMAPTEPTPEVAELLRQKASRN